MHEACSSFCSLLSGSCGDWFGATLVFYVGARCCECPSKCRFKGIPQIVMLFPFHFIWYITFSNLPFDFLTCGWFRSVSHTFQRSGDFPDSFLLLISTLILLWPEDTFSMNLILFDLLRLTLWPRTLSISGSVFCALSDNMYSAVIGWSVLATPIRSNHLVVALHVTNLISINRKTCKK